MANDIRFDINGIYKIDDSQARATLGKIQKEAQSLFMKKDMPLTKRVRELTQEIKNQDGTVSKVTRTFVQYKNALGQVVDAQGKLLRNQKGQFVGKEQWQMISEKTVNTVQKETKEIKNLDNQMQSLNATQKEGVHSSNNLDLSFRSLGETLVKVAKFKIVTEALMAFIQVGNEALEIVKDFDNAMVEFVKVSDLSGDALDEYAQKLGELGEITMKSRTQMLESATEFVKSGYSEEQSADLATVATMFQNVADSELSAGDSASYIISQMKAFGYTTTEEAQSIIDKTNEV